LDHKSGIARDFKSLAQGFEEGEPAAADPFRVVYVVFHLK
jgi:hypothetical protein